jgi:lysophospholipase L1-like esterase
MDRIVLPYDPREVVLYAGDNDLALGRPPSRLLADFQTFATRLHSAAPAARLIYVSIKPSPSRRQYLERAREANRAIQDLISRDTLATFVDVFSPMLNPQGQPRPELFLDDSLHMTRAGYLLWRGLLDPLIN